MELALSNDQESRLRELAELEGKGVGELLLHAAERLIHADDIRWAEVDEAIAQADRGELIDEHDMDKRTAAMLTR